MLFKGREGLCEDDQERKRLNEDRETSKNDQGQHPLRVCQSAAPGVLRTKIGGGQRLAGCSIAPVRPKTSEVHHSLHRLTECRRKGDNISSALAWDDLTGMKLDAGMVAEARSKEVQYIRDNKSVR